VVVWVADDRADTDGDADRDSNGLITVRAVALGPDDASAALEATLAREAGRVRAVAIRPRP
jgi:hypothetical protein